MSATWNRRGIGIAFVAGLAALGLLARPPIGAAQSIREADGARLLKGALDLHFHMDPWVPGSVNGQAGIAEVRVARSRGMRGLVIKDHNEPTAPLAYHLRPEIPGLEYPDAVRSLVSIMSTTGNRWKGQPSFAVYRYLLRQAPEERQAFIEYTTRVFEAIGSRGLPFDRDRVRDMVARSYDRGRDPASPGRQLGAIIASGDRTSQLRTIRTPTLVIHGSNDKMVAKSGGAATARAIPGARLMIVEGMGHDLPEAAWPQLVEAIAGHARAADAAAAEGAQLSAS
jgi:hypothetical protein